MTSSMKRTAVAVSASRRAASRPASGANGSIDKSREIDRAQQAGAVRRQWLLAAIVRQKTIGIEGIDAGHAHVEDVLVAIGLDRCDGRDEALAIHGSPVVGDGRAQTGALVAIGKADQFRESKKVSPATTSSC